MRRPRATGIERLVYGLAILGTAIPLLLGAGASGSCDFIDNPLDLAQCQRDLAKTGIQVVTISAGLATAGLVLAIYALSRPRSRRIAMIFMIGVFVVGYLLLAGINRDTTSHGSYDPLPSLSGYDWERLWWVMTAGGVLLALLVIVLDRRRQRDHSHAVGADATPTLHWEHERGAGTEDNVEALPASGLPPPSSLLIVGPEAPLDVRRRAKRHLRVAIVAAFALVAVVVALGLTPTDYMDRNDWAEALGGFAFLITLGVAVVEFVFAIVLRRRAKWRPPLPLD
jgi:hypothetical protein